MFLRITLLFREGLKERIVLNHLKTATNACLILFLLRYVTSVPIWTRVFMMRCLTRVS